MAYLNTEEREALLHELSEMPFKRVMGRLHRIDPKGRMSYFRNAQRSGFLETRFILEGLGTKVVIVEKHDREPAKDGEVYNSKYEMVEIAIEPLPDNRL